MPKTVKPGQTTGPARSGRTARSAEPAEPLVTALQRGAGNVATTSLVHRGIDAHLLASTDNQAHLSVLLASRNPTDRVQRAAVSVQRAPGPLTPAQEKSAVTFTKATYDTNSVRAIQVIAGAKVDGKFGAVSAQAVAGFQQARGIAVSGQADQPTLDAVVAQCVTNGDHDFGIYAAADFFGIATRSSALTVSFKSGQGTAGATVFESGGLRAITLGPNGITNSAKIRDTINAQLALPVPAVPVAAPTPKLLKAAQVKSAVASNRKKLRDPRSIRAIQGFIGSTPSGLFDVDTVQRIANFQNGAGLTEDGKIGRATLNPLVMGLNGAASQNGAIRAVIDFYRLDENGLVDIHFDTADANNATTRDQAIPGNSRITVSPKAFAQGFAGLVHTIAHEIEHVRQNRVGIADLPLSEFLGERVEILSKGMDEEALAGFMNDARRALTQWNLMPAAQRRANFAKFVEVRNKVRARLAKAAPISAANQATLNGYNAVVKP